jgi:hypothetical protein
MDERDHVHSDSATVSPGIKFIVNLLGAIWGKFLDLY